MKLSVIIPVYNVSEYLRQCLDSVIYQTFSEMEIILVNDGSTDNSGDICKEYALKDSRVIYLEQKNAGLAAARQTGLEAACGDYIAFVDSDDWLELNMYERMLSVALDNDADIVFCNTYRNESKKEEPYLESGLYNREEIETKIFPRLLGSFDSAKQVDVLRWCNWLRLYKKELIDKYDITFDKRFRRCQDLPFTFECTIRANRYYYLGEDYLYHNRMNYESLSKGYTKNMWGLIKPLIAYLWNVVDNYKEYDFNGQMKLRSALFAFDCVDNELKPNNTRSFGEQLSTIRSIMKDKDVIEWLKDLNMPNMNKMTKIYIFCFKYKLAVILYCVSRYRYRSRFKEYKSIQKQKTNEQ